MKKRKAFPNKNIRNLVIGLVILVVIAVLVVFFIKYQPFSKENISVKPILLKLSIAQGGEVTNNVKITNNQDTTQTFNVYINNLDGVVYIEEENFILDSGESKNLLVYFRDVKNEVGVYVGQLIIKSSDIQKAIPIMLTVEDKNNIFAIIHSPMLKYDNVYPGGKFGVEIKIVDITGRIISPKVRAKYSIQNFEGDLIWMDENDLIIKESWAEIVDIPKNLDYGDYVFVTLIDYNGIKSVSGYIFSVSEKRAEISQHYQ